jgi:outer membrane protein OmpA-like peptidoglycan-associated protein
MRLYLNFLFFLLFSPNACVSLWAQQAYLIEKLGPHINTTADEITPIVDWDGKVLYFTRVGAEVFNKNLIIDSIDQATVLSPFDYNNLLREVYSKIAETAVADPVHSSYNQDIWVAMTTRKDFDKVVHPPAPINNALPNSISSMMPALRTFLVVNQFIPEGGMDVGFSVVKQLSDSTWSFPEPLAIENYYTQQAGTSVNISSDGKVMIMGLSRADSYGDLDLYISFKNSDGSWSSPKNLGPKINTKFRESTPFLSQDMRRLYFASNRPSSLGGMDLYYVDRESDSWGSWSEERHFVYPINSSFDDSQPCFSPSTGFFFFTSKREGNSDIYRVQTAPPQPQKVMIRGKITSGIDGSAIDADILFTAKEQEEWKINYSKNGEFSISIPKGLEYKFIAQKDGYISNTKYVKVEKYEHYPQGYQMDIKMVPIKEGEKIVLNNLYFKQSEPEILPQSFDELNDLADILIEHKDIKIQIEGHTDNSGNATDLIHLSEERALAVKVFLMKRGVKSERMLTKGFGGTEPIFPQPKDEKERQANRRVEIKIVNK